MKGTRQCLVPPFFSFIDLFQPPCSSVHLEPWIGAILKIEGQIKMPGSGYTSLASVGSHNEGMDMI
jgi:hypothetical protein